MMCLYLSRAVIQQNRIILDSAAGSLIFDLVEPR